RPAGRGSAPPAAPPPPRRRPSAAPRRRDRSGAGPPGRRRGPRPARGDGPGTPRAAAPCPPRPRPGTAPAPPPCSPPPAAPVCRSLVAWYFPRPWSQPLVEEGPQLPQCPRPELLHGARGPPQAPGHLVPAQPLQVVQHDHLAVVLAQLRQGVRQH